MRIGIFYHPPKVELNSVQKTQELLLARGAEVKIFTSADAIEDVDRLIVFGGDGSILHAARKVSLLGIPLVAVNYGTIGFLAEFEKHEEEKLVDLVLNESCQILNRTALEVCFRGQKFFCLNEVTIMREISATCHGRTSRFSVSISGRDAGDFTADGLIVATPTGSTAYSLAAGGSILTPDCEAFMLTPVCAFSMRSRPIACSDKSVLSFCFPEGSALVIHGDGIFIGKATEEDIITVRKSRRSVMFLTRDKNGFFRHLTEKIS